MVYGAFDQIRTDDPFLTMEVLYLLSYEGKIYAYNRKLSISDARASSFLQPLLFLWELIECRLFLRFTIGCTTGVCASNYSGPFIGIAGLHGPV